MISLMAIGEIIYHRRQNPDDIYPRDEKTQSRRCEPGGNE